MNEQEFLSEKLNSALDILEPKEDILAKEIEEFERNYVCKKCNTNYCEHMKRAMTRRFGKRIDECQEGRFIIAVMWRSLNLN